MQSLMRSSRDRGGDNVALLNLTTLCIGFAVAFVENDAFALYKAQQGAGGLYHVFNVWSYGERAAQIYSLTVAGASLASLLFVTPSRLRHYTLLAYTIICGVLLVPAVARLAMDQGLLVAFAGTEIRAFLPILYLPFGVFCMAVWFPALTRMLLLGFLSGVCAKALILCLGYVWQGGVPFYDTVASTIDGSVLSNLAIGALALAGVTFCRYTARRDLTSVVLACLGVLCVIVIIASFRRSILLKTGLSAFAATAMFLYVNGRLWRLMPGLLGATIASVVLVATIYAVVFGAERATDRMHSLWGTSYAAELGDSNRYYEDDQDTLWEVVEKSNWFGVGFRNEYGTSARLHGGDNEAEYAVTEIPLHVGTYELLARQGVFAIPFIFGCFLILPITSLRWLRCLNLEWQVAGCLSAAWLLVNGLWPFAPPPYLNSNIWMSFCVAIGVLAAARYEALVENGGSNRSTGDAAGVQVCET
jgi:hypothetical protein